MATANWRNSALLSRQDGKCPLVSKLELFAPLSPNDVAALEFLCGEPQRLPGQQVLIEQGDRPENLAIVIHGLAIRYRSLPGRRRQVLGYLVSGDLSDPFYMDGEPFDHSIMLLGDSLVTTVPMTVVRGVMRNHPQIERAMLLAVIAEQAILREWLLNIGQRSAREKLGHFFCEMAVRLASVGQANRDGSVDLPLNQNCVADTTGLTHIHVNRVLKRLRAEGLVVVNKRLLTIPDPERLMAAVEFERDYLQPRAPH